MAISWDDSFVLGIDDIDQQHRTIVEQFERLSAATQEGCASDLLVEIAAFLVEYSHYHFATEERYMTDYHYPYIEDQRAEHAEFTRDAVELVKRIEEEGASREMATVLTGKMIRWVINHVRNHDREMVQFVLERMNSEK